MEKNRKKFKVLPLPFYQNFRRYDFFEDVSTWTDEEVLNHEAKEFLTTNNYDGPLRYLARCEPQEFPIRDGMMYCVRLTKEEKEAFGKTSKGQKEKSRGVVFDELYHCYSYQLGVWWKVKIIEYLYYDIYIPTFPIEKYYELKEADAYKFLSYRHRRTCEWWDFQESLKDSRKSNLRARKRFLEFKKEHEL